MDFEIEEGDPQDFTSAWKSTRRDEGNLFGGDGALEEADPYNFDLGGVKTGGSRYTL